MNDKYKFLQENPKNCKRLFGIEFELFKNVLEKVQKYFEDYLRQYELGNRGEWECWKK